MKKFFYKTGVALANQSGAMEADTISKNGQSSKSQMSRKHFLNYFVIATVVVMAVFTSCSSPESKGKKAAKEFCDCEMKNIDFLQKEYSKFVKKFNTYNFQTRIEVQEKKQEIDNNAIEKYNECKQKAEENRIKAREKYTTNEQKKSQFDYAFNNNNCNKYEVRENKITPLESQIEDLRLSVIPLKPAIERIKHDLIGHRITEPSNNIYHRSFDRNYWSLNIKEEEMKDIKIITENQQGEDGDYLIDVQLILQASGGVYEVLINMTYVLHQYNDWTRNSFECKDVNMVKTGKYEKCVTIERGSVSEFVSGSGWNTEIRREYVERLRFTNNCEEDLVIGGAILSGGEWKKFLTVLHKPYMTSDPYSFTQQRYWVQTTFLYFSVRFEDYKIHFIEQQ